MKVELIEITNAEEIEEAIAFNANRDVYQAEQEIPERVYKSYEFIYPISDTLSICKAENNQIGITLKSNPIPMFVKYDQEIWDKLSNYINSQDEEYGYKYTGTQI